MPFIKAISQAAQDTLIAQNREAFAEAGDPRATKPRTYYLVTYDRFDGANWAALVLEVWPGEEVISAEETQAIFAANVAAMRRRVASDGNLSEQERAEHLAAIDSWERPDYSREGTVLEAGTFAPADNGIPGVETGAVFDHVEP